MTLWVVGLMFMAFGVYGFFPAPSQTWIMPTWACVALIIAGAVMALLSGRITTPNSVED